MTVSGVADVMVDIKNNGIGLNQIDDVSGTLERGAIGQHQCFGLGHPFLDLVRPLPPSVDEAIHQARREGVLGDDRRFFSESPKQGIHGQQASDGVPFGTHVTGQQKMLVAF